MTDSDLDNLPLELVPEILEAYRQRTPLAVIEGRYSATRSQVDALLKAHGLATWADMRAAEAAPRRRPARRLPAPPDDGPPEQANAVGAGACEP